MIALNLTVDEALAHADDWTRGKTFDADSRGMNAIMLVLAEEVRRLRAADSAKRLALVRLYRWARAGDPRIEYGGDHPVALAREALLEEGEASE